ncbi:midnolin-like [Fundulus heteroclitus]|uniref:midnolin-like n=1 Tax=Fundulus heteroclitus TaxID=8078 RepID=UPI00165BF8E0|nr:midnolin-like [Fundulus heteroclitus]
MEKIWDRRLHMSQWSIHKCSGLTVGRSTHTCGQLSSTGPRYKNCARTAGGCQSVTVVVHSLSADVSSRAPASSPVIPLVLHWLPSESASPDPRYPSDDLLVPPAVLIPWIPPVLLGPTPAPASHGHPSPPPCARLRPHCPLPGQVPSASCVFRFPGPRSCAPASAVAD